MEEETPERAIARRLVLPMADEWGTLAFAG